MKNEIHTVMDTEDLLCKMEKFLVTNFSLSHRSSENLIHLYISWFLPSLIALVTGVARHPQDLCWLVLTLVDPSVCTMLPIQAWLWAASPTEV